MFKKKRTSNRNTRKKRILTIVGLLIFIPLLIYGISYGMRIYNLYNTVHEPIDEEEFVEVDPSSWDDEDADQDEEEEEIVEESEPVPDGEVEGYRFADDAIYDGPRSPRNPDHLNILLMGMDTDVIGGGGRSDSMMVVRFNTKTEEAAILSIPRDTYIRIPGRGYDKAGHAAAYGGTALLKDTVERYLDIHIDHYVRVDMKSLEISVNTLGGLYVNVPQRMVHQNGRVLFEAGNQYMNGEDVLDYTRARKLVSGGGSDFGRIKRQQQIVTIMLEKIRSDLSMNQTLSFMESISGYVRTDVGPTMIARHWNAFNRLNMNSVEMKTLDGNGFMHGGIYYYRVPIENARKTMEGLAN